MPKRFITEVTAIEKVQVVSVMKVDELMIFLLNFEMTIDEKSKKYSKLCHSKWILKNVMTRKEVMLMKSN